MKALIPLLGYHRPVLDSSLNSSSPSSPLLSEWNSSNANLNPLPRTQLFAEDWARSTCQPYLSAFPLLPTPWTSLCCIVLPLTPCWDALLPSFTWWAFIIPRLLKIHSFKVFLTTSLSPVRTGGYLYVPVYQYASYVYHLCLVLLVWYSVARKLFTSLFLLLDSKPICACFLNGKMAPGQV